jgi:hypothetical protein
VGLGARGVQRARGASSGANTAGYSALLCLAIIRFNRFRNDSGRAHWTLAAGAQQIRSCGSRKQ